MKKNTRKILIFIILSILILICILIIINISESKKIKDIVYITTSYTKNETIFYDSKDDCAKTYPIMNVDSVYNLTIGTLIADKYGNKAFLLKEGEPDKKIIFEYYNVYDIEEYDGYIYILFSFSANKCKIVKYDLSFNMIEESIELLGVPRNIVIKNKKIFLVVNDYSISNRITKLRTLSCDFLKIINEIIINDLCFAFMVDYVDNNVIVYGNLDENNFTFSLCVYDDDLLKVSNLNYNVPAQWIRKVIKYNECQLILNDLSIIKINSDYSYIDSFKKEGSLIIDAIIYNNLLYVISSEDATDIVLDVIKIDDFSIKYTKRYEKGLEKIYMMPSCIAEIK